MVVMLPDLTKLQRRAMIACESKYLTAAQTDNVLRQCNVTCFEDLTDEQAQRIITDLGAYKQPGRIWKW